MSRDYLDKNDLPYAARAIEQSLDDIVAQLIETNIVLREIVAALIDECRTCKSRERGYRNLVIGSNGARQACIDLWHG